MATLDMLEAIRRTLDSEMERDDRVVVLGEGVGSLGGVFRTTEGLLQEFGNERVLDTPMAEDGIVGTAVGMALYGLRPVAEVQFADYLHAAFDQVASEVAKLRYRSGGQYACPLVLRAPYGGGVAGGPYQSQSPEAHYAHTAGLRVVVPSTPGDAAGLLRSAVRADDPVLFLEPKRLYRSSTGRVPDGDHTVPLDTARIVREGSDATVFAYGAMVPAAAEAAERAAGRGIDVHLVDLRSLLPLDIETLLDAVARSGRVVVVHEAPKTGGFGGEVAATIAERAVLHLEAPILRVAGLDAPVPHTLEDVVLPGVEEILDAVERVVEF